MPWRLVKDPKFYPQLPKFPSLPNSLLKNPVLESGREKSKKADL